MNKPNFRTINRFRSEKLTDGRFESVANKYIFVWKGSVEKNKSKLLVKVNAILKEAEAVLEEENISDFHDEITKEDLKQRTDRILILTDMASKGSC